MGVAGRESFVPGPRRRGTLVATWMIGEVTCASKQPVRGIYYSLKGFNELVMTVCYEKPMLRSSKQ